MPGIPGTHTSLSAAMWPLFLTWSFFDIRMTYSASPPSPQHQHEQVISKSDKDNCPISSHIEWNKTGLFNYPFELYDPAEISSLYQDPDDFVPCEVNGGKDNGGAYYYNCTTSLLHCPLNDDDIRVALQFDEYGLDFCDFRDVLLGNNNDDDDGIGVTKSNKEGESIIKNKNKSVNKNINVIIFGGSVTKGLHAHYTIPCPNRTKSSTSQGNIRYAMGDILRDRRDGSCYLQVSTFQYLHHHLEELGRAHNVIVTLHSFEMAATHSGWAMQHIHDLFLSAGIKSLRSSDLVFIDYSYNDGALFQNEQVDTSNLFVMLEGLVATLLSYREEDTTQGIPRLILTDHYPYPNPPKPAPNDYRDTLASVAQRYNCSLWSPRAMLQSAWNDGRQNLLFAWALYRKSSELHPYFYVHLLVADLYTRILEAITSSTVCEKSMVGKSDKSRSSSRATAAGEVSAFEDRNMLFDAQKRYGRVTAVVPWVMPERLTKNTHLCDRTLDTQRNGSENEAASYSSILIEAQAMTHMRLQINGVMNNSKHESEAAFPLAPTSAMPEVSPWNTWRLYEDRPGKPGWIIDTGRLNESLGGSLVFSANEAEFADWRERFITNRAVVPSGKAKPKVILRVEYLQTYENAGSARVEVMCGSAVLGVPYYLDALWQGARNMHFSLTSLAIMDITKDILSCEKNIIRVNITSPAFKGYYRKSLLDLATFHTTTKGVDINKHTGNCKFKIIGVTACRSTT